MHPLRWRLQAMVPCLVGTSNFPDLHFYSRWLIMAYRCMGYHSSRGVKNMKFVCFDCRVRADQNWDLIMVHDLYPTMMERFRDLALFRYSQLRSQCHRTDARSTHRRRAIKVYEEHNPPVLSSFTKLMGTSPLLRFAESC